MPTDDIALIGWFEGRKGGVVCWQCFARARLIEMGERGRRKLLRADFGAIEVVKDREKSLGDGRFMYFIADLVEGVWDFAC